MASENATSQPIETQSRPQDPFANKRTEGDDPFTQENDNLGDIAGNDDMKLESSSPPENRRTSREWDASKVPPSQFQKRKGSIYSTPSSRDGHVRGKDEAYHAKIKEKGWGKK